VKDYYFSRVPGWDRKDSSHESVRQTPLDSLKLLPYIRIVVLMFECQRIFDKVR